MAKLWLDITKFIREWIPITCKTEPLDHSTNDNEAIVLAEQKLKELGYEQIDLKSWEREFYDWAEDIEEFELSKPISVWEKITNNVREIVVICKSIND